jgi:8-oxo-dGTP pyrophosphatase MutT (NUDIX family)
VTAVPDPAPDRATEAATEAATEPATEAVTEFVTEPAPDPAVVRAHAALQADTERVLRDWVAPDLGQSALREAFLGLLAARPDATARSCGPGHVTASAVVLSADLRSVLLTLHRRLGLWLQLGGHCEPGDGTLLGAAAREAAEESGLAGLRPVLLDGAPGPVHLDVHPITCSLGRPTRHFDVRWAFVAAPGAVPVISAESTDLRFHPVDALPSGATGVDASVRAAVAAARARAGR